MELKNKTILITGGASGIGLEIVKLLAIENKVLIVGRNEEKLNKAAQLFLNIIPIQADITNESDVNFIESEVQNKYRDLSILINNAGQAFVYELSENSNSYEKAKAEFDINYLAPIRLTEKLLPFLKKQSEAAIVNVSSIVGLTPSLALPTYSDSKAALHSHTQSLRYSLSKNTNIKVFELMPPLVDTEFSVAIGGKENGIPASQVAEDLVKAMTNEVYEIYVGKTEAFHDGFFAHSKEAFISLNGLK